jgi:tRNA dimethylallyltransferase
MMGYDRGHTLLQNSDSALPHVLPLIVIAGPTGSGKTALALQIAHFFGGEIVNCDSLQLYQGFDVGTAKTAREDRQGVPHHLFDVLAPEVGYSAGEYARAARKVLAEISTRARLPLVVGGTGFYLRALLEGLPALPSKNDSVRQRLLGREERRPGSLHRILSRLDPASATRIHHSDIQKLTRAMELRLLTRGPRPAPKSATPLPGYRTFILSLDPDRTRLAERIEQRTRRMFEHGLLKEVRGLLAQGLSGSEKPFEALGYKQALQVLRGDLSVEEAIEATTIATRQYAKRQRTWFRRKSELHSRVQSLNSFGDESCTQRLAIDVISDWLASTDEAIESSAIEKP